ncbi:protein IQ-DOMAIN 3-like [Wolffia australiana]
MGEKGSWFGALKKVFSPEPKDQKKKKTKKKKKNEESSGKSKRKWGFGKSKEESGPPIQIPTDKIKATEADNDHAYSVASAAAAAAEAAVVAAQAAAAVVRLTSSSAQFAGRSKEEISAIKIQTAFRGYLARKSLRGLKGLARLKTLMGSCAVKRQTTATLRCMQTLCRVQTQIRTRRIRMLEQNQTLHRQIRRDHDLESLRSFAGEEWDDRVQTKEQIAASMQLKQEAAMRRERALAYAFSHQGKGIARGANPTFTDPSNPQWGWSWAERWTAATAWDWRRRSPCGSAAVRGGAAAEDDARSLASAQSERGRRLSTASSVRDDESLASSPAVPGYMAPTESTRARSRLSSPDLTAPARKRLSFHAAAAVAAAAASPAAPRRHSGPPRMETRSLLGR